MFAAIHVSPFISLPLSAMMLALMVWYWRRLATSEVPDTRRRIRRASLMVMVAAVAVLVRAVSFVDAAVNQNDYVISWVMATALLLLMVFTAFLDAINNLRLHRGDRNRLRGQAIDRIASATSEVPVAPDEQGSSSP